MANGNLMYGSGNSNRASVSIWRGRMGREMGGGFIGGRGYMYTYGWFMLRFDRKQQNSVKQLSFNKNIIFFLSLAFIGGIIIGVSCYTGILKVSQFFNKRSLLILIKKEQSVGATWHLFCFLLTTKPYFLLQTTRHSLTTNRLEC